MFTGLIADVATVTALDPAGAGARLAVRTGLAGELHEGASIAVNGVCLTARAVGEEAFEADVIGETLARSSLGGLRAGARVNLELPLRAGDRLGGHVVQGHVDGTGTVGQVRSDGFGRVLDVTLEPRLERYLAEKGSVALDGVSLTVSAVREGGLQVSLIPETLQRTNLGALEVGDRVNVEVDVLAKHLERLVGAHAGVLAAEGR